MNSTKDMFTVPYEDMLPLYGPIRQHGKLFFGVDGGGPSLYSTAYVDSTAFRIVMLLLSLSALLLLSRRNNFSILELKMHNCRYFLLGCRANVAQILLQLETYCVPPPSIE